MAINGFPSNGSPQSPTSGAVTINYAPKSLEPSAVTVAASQTLATLSGRKGAYLKRLIIQPASTSPGVVTLYDGDGTNKIIKYSFPGGASSLTELKPIVVDFDVRCSVVETGAEGWYVTTGANVSVTAIVQVG